MFQGLLRQLLLRRHRRQRRITRRRQRRRRFPRRNASLEQSASSSSCRARGRARRQFTGRILVAQLCVALIADEMSMKEFVKDRVEIGGDGHVHLNDVEMLEKTREFLRDFRRVEGENVGDVLQLFPLILRRRVESSRIDVLTNEFRQGLILIPIDLQENISSSSSRGARSLDWRQTWAKFRSSTKQNILRFPFVV